MQSILETYADLLCRYCVDLQPGDKLYIKTTTLAEPLVRAVYRRALAIGAITEVDFSFCDQDRWLLAEGNDDQLSHVPILESKAMATFDAYMFIKAPYNLKAPIRSTLEKEQVRRQALKSLRQDYFSRSASLDLKRTFCVYPTLTAAQEAGMSLEEYEHFVFSACGLFESDPMQFWLDLKADQQRIVDLLNNRQKIRYQGPGVDISFSTAGRTWINSHGTTNMPSGEVYTSPVEDSVNGHIRFDYPLVYKQSLIEDIAFKVEDGYIKEWEASAGKDLLDEIMSVDGARRFGEAAIGTNRHIDQFTRNVLFDEKIGGTVHMAIGQSYAQAGGQNTSDLHLDIIKEMRHGGEIYADDELIYRDGNFIL